MIDTQKHVNPQCATRLFLQVNSVIVPTKVLSDPTELETTLQSTLLQQAAVAVAAASNGFHFAPNGAVPVPVLVGPALQSALEWFTDVPSATACCGQPFPFRTRSRIVCAKQDPSSYNDDGHGTARLRARCAQLSLDVVTGHWRLAHSRDAVFLQDDGRERRPRRHVGRRHQRTNSSNGAQPVPDDELDDSRRSSTRLQWTRSSNGHSHAASRGRRELSDADAVFLHHYRMRG